MEVVTVKNGVDSVKSVGRAAFSDISRPSGVYVQVVKPLFDLLSSLSLLVITSPLFLIVSLLIKLDSNGPIIFKQERYGINGKLFNIYKFRTMYTDVPNEGRSPISGNDPRITPLGRFLRKTSIDELPQLFNIVRGEMSFIGPRPEQKSIVDNIYTEYERLRFLAAPGITGLWQISQDRKDPIHENIHHDLSYIAEISFLLDLKIIYRTLMVIVKSNTY